MHPACTAHMHLLPMRTVDKNLKLASWASTDTKNASSLESVELKEGGCLIPSGRAYVRA